MKSSASYKQCIGLIVALFCIGSLAQDACQFSGQTEQFLNVLENTNKYEVVYTAPFTANDSVITIDVTPNKFFAFSKENRTLYVNDTLDAELILISQKIEVTCRPFSPLSLQKTIYLFISIIDVNDNGPIFTSNVYNITVGELMDVSTIITTGVKAVDADYTPELNRVYYSILDGPYAPYFSLQQMLSTDVILLRKLDFETTPQMNLTIVAKDNPKRGAPFSATCVLIINIKDEDDQNPVFSASMYRGLVSNNASLGSVVPTEPKIFAYDPDVTIRANVTYSFHDSTGQSNLILEIHNVTAVITLKSKPTASEIYLLIQATQVDNPSRYGVALLTILVQGSNVNAPVFTRTSYNVVVTESFPKGEVVTSVVASDADSDNPIIYSLDDPSAHFSINNLTGDVILVKELSYANKSKYSLQVSASDGTLKTNATLVISVWPGYRHPPQISTTARRVDAKRNKGDIIIKIEANDTDSGTKLSYKLITYAELFSIDQQGQIMITAEPHLLVNNLYPLTVVVSDGGWPSYESSVVIIVSFPANNGSLGSLVFSSLSYSVTITETFPRGHVITTMVAISNNPIPNIVYSIQNYEEHFVINSTTGDVILAMEVSYTNQSMYVLNVTAQDGKMETTASLTINIWPVNRYPPQILTQTRQVNAQRNKGDVILKIEARDAETNVTYSLLSFTDLFAINQQGEIMLIADGSKFTYNSYAITVVVSDSGLPSYESAAVVTVNFPPLPAALVAAAEIDQTAAIVLGVIAGVFLVIIIVLLVVIYKRRLSNKEHLDRAKKPVVINDTRGLTFRQKQGTFGRQAKINMSFVDDVTEIGNNVQENPLTAASPSKQKVTGRSDPDNDISDIVKNPGSRTYYNFEQNDQDNGSFDIQFETTMRPEGSDHDYVYVNENSDKLSQASIDSEEHSPTEKIGQFYRNGSISTNHDSSDSDFSYSPSPVDSNGIKKMLMPGSLATTKVPEETLSYQDEPNTSFDNSSSMENVNSDDFSYSPSLQKQELTVYF